MKLHELAPKIPKKARKRRGQGNATGNGTYGGRGCKGQNARSGGGVRLGFEGGQTPLIQRMPKQKGFKNPNKIPARVLSVERLTAIFDENAIITYEVLREKGLISRRDKRVKILAGECDKPLTIKGIELSAAAKEAIEKAGGKVEQ